MRLVASHPYFELVYAAVEGIAGSRLADRFPGVPAKPRTLLVMHLFNHQTHHRGQAHATLTAAGQATGDTDLPWIVLA